MSGADYSCLLEPYPGKHNTRLWLQQSISHINDQNEIILWLLNDQCLTPMVTIKRKYETLCGSYINFNNVVLFIESMCVYYWYQKLYYKLINISFYLFTTYNRLIMKVHMKKCFMLFLNYLFLYWQNYTIQSNYFLGQRLKT